MGIGRTALLLAMLALAGCVGRIDPPPPEPEEPEMASFPHVEKGRPGKTQPRPAYRVGEPYKIAGRWYYPKIDYDYDVEGRASWYGPNFHGKLTANGELFDQNALTGAHQTLPLPSIIRVTNLENGRSLILRINDRGPFVANRILDVSRKAAKLLNFHDQGTTRVRVEVLERESKAAAAELGARG